MPHKPINGGTLPGQYGFLRFNSLFSTFLLVVLVSSSLFIIAMTQTQDFEPYSQKIPGTDVEINMVPVEGGTYTMGRDDGEANEGPAREVEVESFWMAEHEMTWEQYDLFVREATSDLEQQIASDAEDLYGLTADAVSLPTAPYVDMSFGMGRDGYPAISMTHYAAVMYAKWLTAKTGEFHRLPTEAEWEYACRGGIEGGYAFDGNAGALEDYEWHEDNSDRSYNSVADKQANPLGLYDMKGNVSEWTMDQYHEDYYEMLEGDVAVNPWFKPDELYPRAVRGGSWRDTPEEARCTQRRGSEERWKRQDPQVPKSLWWHTSADFVGFRVIRPKETPSREEMEEYWIEPMEDY